jgi:cobaltochelatase CobS
LSNLETNDALKTMLEALENDVQKKINSTVEQQIGWIKKIAEKGSVLTVNVRNKSQKLEGLKHKQLINLVTIVAQKLPTIIVGPAGTGKTHAGEQAATALGINFYAMSVGAQTSKSDIIGYMSANGTYVPTLFRKAYEEGGLFMMDEIDAGNANVLIQINAALSNNYCAFPDKMVKRSEDFVFVGTANTFGDGASRQYVGRNQLDAATLDRFVYLQWDIDNELEELLAGNTSDGKKWLRVVRDVRKWANSNVERVIVSPRATERGVKLLRASMPYSQVTDAALLGSFPQDKRTEAKTIADRAWNRSV